LVRFGRGVIRFRKELDNDEEVCRFEENGNYFKFNLNWLE